MLLSLCKLQIATYILNRKRIQISQQVVKNPTIMIPESYGYDDPCNSNNNANTTNTTDKDVEEELDTNVGDNKDTIKLSNKQAAELSTQLQSTATSTTKGPSNKATELISSNQLLSTGLSEEERQHQAHFFAQRFTTEWRICLKKASVDFDRAMQLFWSEVRSLFVCMCYCLFVFGRVFVFDMDIVICLVNTSYTSKLKSYAHFLPYLPHSIYCLGIRGSIKLQQQSKQ